MTDDFGVDAAEFERIGAQIKAAGRDLQKVTRKVIGTAAKSAMRDVVKDGSAAMPQRGGLAARLAQSKVAYYPTSDWAGLRVILGTRKRGQLGRINRGLLRHPVFAGRAGEDRKKWTWVPQTVPSGTYVDAINKHIGEIKDAQLTAMQVVLDKVGK